MATKVRFATTRVFQRIRCPKVSHVILHVRFIEETRSKSPDSSTRKIA